MAITGGRGKKEEISGVEKTPYTNQGKKAEGVILGVI